MIIECNNPIILDELYEKAPAHNDADALIYIIPYEKSFIINKIINRAGECLYPDILFSHTFDEAEYISDELYTYAHAAHKMRSTAACIFLCLCPDDTEKACNLIAAISEIFSEKCGISTSEQTAIAELSTALSLSESMKHAILKLFSYYKASGHDILSLYAAIKEEYTLPVSKNEGKKIYEFIQKQILG